MVHNFIFLYYHFIVHTLSYLFNLILRLGNFNDGHNLVVNVVKKLHTENTDSVGFLRIQNTNQCLQCSMLHVYGRLERPFVPVPHAYMYEPDKLKSGLLNRVCTR